MLDIKTLMMLYLIINVISAGAMAIIWGQHRGRFAGVTFWLVDMILQAAGSVLIVLRGLIPDLISMTVSNALILAGALILLIGLERFTRKKGWHIHNYLLLAVFIAVSAYFVIVQPNLVAREIAVSVMTIILTFQCCWLLLRRVDPGQHQMTRLTGIVFAGYVALDFARIILTIITPDQTNDFFKSGAVGALAITGYIVLSTCLTISLVMMMNRRLLADVKTEEEALRESEEKYKALFSAESDAIFVVDKKTGIITDCNDSVTTIYGYQKAELIGQPNTTVSAEPDVTRASTKEFKNIIPIRYHKRKDGTVFPVEITANVISVQGRDVIIAATRDITERKQVEDAAKSSLSLLNASIESTADGLLIVDGKGKIEKWNQKFADMWNIPIEVLANRDDQKTINHILSQLADPEQFVAKVSQLYGQPEESSFDQIEFLDGRVFERYSQPQKLEDNIVGRVWSFRDVTGSKRAEEALRESEERFQLAIAATKDGIWEWDIQSNQEYFSPRWCEIIGYSFDDPELSHTYNSWASRIHPDDLDRVSRALKDHLEKGARYEVEYRHRHKSGEYRWQTSRGQAIFDEVGKPVKMVGCISDITERKRDEEALREGEAKFRNILEQMQDSYYEVDLSGNYTYVNESTGHSFGYSYEEMIGKNYHLTVPEEDIKSVLAAFNAVYRTGKPNKEFSHKIRRKDGAIIFSEVSIDLNRNAQGEVIGFKCVSRDITGRKKAEQALKESEEKHRAVIERASDVIVIIQDGIIRFANPRVAILLGYAPGEVIGRTLASFIPQENLGLALERYQKRMAGEKLSEIYETALLHKSGRNIPVEASGSVIQYAGKQADLAIIRDITERKREEEQIGALANLLSSANVSVTVHDLDGAFIYANKATLDLHGYSRDEFMYLNLHELDDPESAKLIAPRIQQLMETGETSFEVSHYRKDRSTFPLLVNVRITEWGEKKAILSVATDITDRKQWEEEQKRVEKLESIGTLAGGIAHNFNNILTMILGNISLAGMEAAPGSELQKSLEQAEKASLRAKDLTLQLLTFSKGGAPVKEIASVTELLEDTTNSALGDSNVKCRFSIPDGLWQAEIDARQVSQAIYNLVINAQQAMPAGGTIELLAENIALSKTQGPGKGMPIKAGDYIRIAITDHGSGIPKEHLEKIFDPFFTTKINAHGLGVATSFSIARQHGGHLSVESKVGSGSTFYLYLPASAPKQAKKKAIKAAAKARILVMDDEQGVREVAGRMLKHIGYEDVECAADGAEAIKLYKSSMKSGNPFGVAILDLTIPGGMGGEVTIQKLLDIDPEVKAIVSSGYIDDPVMAGYSEYGFSGMITKPYTLEELRKAVQDVIG